MKHRHGWRFQRRRLVDAFKGAMALLLARCPA
jgi:hypothetical protein